MENSTTTSPCPYETNINAIALPICCVLALIITIVPFKAHWAHKNVGLCSLIVVLGISNIIRFINAILWPNDDISKWWAGYGYCDVLAKISYPLFTADATTTCCITLNLARAVDIDNPISQTRAAKKRRIILDLLFCFAVPVLQLGLHYVIQPNRYAIGTVYGCENTLDNSWPTIVIMFMWCPIFALINTYYAVLVAYRLHKHRNSFANTLSSTGSNMTSRRFLRLFIFSSSVLVIYLPVISYYFYLNLTDINLSSESYSWSRIHDPDVWPTIDFWKLADQPGLQYDGWPNVAQSVLVFFFFGMGNEALEAYRRFFLRIGLGKVWPRLNEPIRNNSFSRRGSTASSSGRFDLVGFALRYFDSSRKPSQGTVTECSIHSKSRKGSTATFDHISLAHWSNRAKSPSEVQRRDTLTPDTFSTHPDTISPAPLSATLSTPEPALISGPSTPSSQSYPSPTRGVLGPFRTQLSLPFPLFQRSKFNKRSENCSCTPSTSPNAAPHCSDLEAQNCQQVQPDTTPTSPLPFTNHSTVQTQIWADSSSRSNDEDDDEPRLGTRAYRERERREMEALRRERKAVRIESSIEQTRT